MTEAIKKKSLRVHSILYGNEPNRILQAIEHLNRAADFAIASGDFEEVSLVYGDCSPEPTLSDEMLGEIRLKSYALTSIEHRFFDANLGSAGGHNRLLEDMNAEFVLVMNPDIMLAPNTLLELLKPFQARLTGMVEARQLPIEHPKEYDVVSGETPWAATACTLIPKSVIDEVGSFDHETFFLYCDDVDFSWRVRLSGKKVIYQPSAIAYHDKRLGQGGKWVPGEAEKYYSAEAALLLAYKYSRMDIVQHIIADFEAAEQPHFARALANYKERQVAGRLPKQLDGKQKIAKFVDGAYAIHRFPM